MKPIFLAPEQIEKRRSFTKGSDTPKLCGLNPAQAPINVWRKGRS